MTVVQHSYLKLRIIVSQSRQDAMAVRRGGKSNQSDYNFFAPSAAGRSLRLCESKKSAAADGSVYLSRRIAGGGLLTLRGEKVWQELVLVDPASTF